MSSVDSALGDLEQLLRLTALAIESLQAGDLEAVASRESQRRKLMEQVPWPLLSGNRLAIDRLEQIVALDRQLRDSASEVRDSLGQALVRQRRSNNAISAYHQIDGKKY